MYNLQLHKRQSIALIDTFLDIFPLKTIIKYTPETAYIHNQPPIHKLSQPNLAYRSPRGVNNDEQHTYLSKHSLTISTEESTSL